MKICDFGLARSVYNDITYKKSSNTPVPVKWIAIESIRDLIFSTKSDVWSFGILLWEIFSLAETPYADIPSVCIYQNLIQGYRLQQPNQANQEM